MHSTAPISVYTIPFFPLSDFMREILFTVIPSARSGSFGSFFRFLEDCGVRVNITEPEGKITGLPVTEKVSGAAHPKVFSRDKEAVV